MESGKFQGFSKSKAAHAYVWAALFYRYSINKEEAGISTCLFFRYNNAVFKMNRDIPLIYDIGLDLTLSEVIGK